MSFALSTQQLQIRPTHEFSKLLSHRLRRPASRPFRTQPIRSMFGGGGKQGDNNPFGALGNLPNLMETVKQAQLRVKEETARVQAELAAAEFEGYNEEETVRVVMNGNQEPLSVDITETAWSQGAEDTSRAVADAMKDAHRKSVAGMKTKMQELASTLGLPAGMPNM